MINYADSGEPADQYQSQETTLSVQIVPELRSLLFDFALVWPMSGRAPRGEIECNVPQSQYKLHQSCVFLPLIPPCIPDMGRLLRYLPTRVLCECLEGSLATSGYAICLRACCAKSGIDL
eukprot:505731-Rhodomonas_salina.1